MQCESMGEMMSARLDGRLSSIEDETLNNHLAACSMCRGAWEALSSVDRVLNAAPILVAPLDLHARVVARLERRKRVRQALIGGLALTLGTLLVALVAVSPAVGWLVGAGSLLPMWHASGPEMAARAISILSTFGRTGAVLLRAFALPIAGVAACVVLLGALVNGLWLGALYRWRPARVRAR